MSKGIFISIIVAGALVTTLMMVPTSPDAPAVESHEGHNHTEEVSADLLQAKIIEADRILQEGVEPPMKAIFLLREVLEEDPNHIGAIMKLGQLSLISGQYDKAEMRFRHAYELAPNTPGVASGMVNALLGQGRTEDASAFAEELGQTQPNHADTKEIQVLLESKR